MDLHSAPDPQGSQQSKAFLDSPIKSSPTPAQLRQIVSTLEQALEALPELMDVSPPTRSEWAQRVRRFAKVVGRPLHEISLAPEHMRPLLAGVLPASHEGLSPKTWGNIRAAVNCLTRRVGWVSEFGRGNASLTSTPWLALVGLVPANPSKPCFTAFARFCERSLISPDEVDERTVEAYRAWRQDNTYDLNIGLAISQVRRVWNSCSAAELAWPKRRLQPPHNPNVFRADLADFHPDFLAEVEEYEAELLAPDPLAAIARTALSPETIRGRRDGLLWAATAIANAGRPLASIQSFQHLVTVPNLRLALMARYEKTGKKWTMATLAIALSFYDIALRRLALPEADLKEMERLKKRARPGRYTMSARIREEVRQFVEDDNALSLFFRLPELMAEQAMKDFKSRRCVQAARLHERALALALLRASPMRRRSLAALEIETHFIGDKLGRIIRFNLPAELSKTAVIVDSAIPRGTAEMFHRHITMFRPLLPHSDGSSWLFPGVAIAIGRNPGTLARGVSSAVCKAMGKRFHVHLVRHIVGSLLLNEDPEAIHHVTRILHHRTAKTTLEVYGHLRTRKADERYAEILEKKLKRAERAGKREK